MSKSLQDQLLALGLAPKSARRVEYGAGSGKPSKLKGKPRRRAQRETDKAGVAASRCESDLSLEQAYRLREEQTQQQAEKVRQRKRLEDALRRQLNQSIREIVEPNRLNDPAAEFSRNFMHKGRIRKVNVTAEQLKALNQGALGLAYLAGGYHILQPEYVRQVYSLSPTHVPDLTSGIGEDDECPVPDDLIW
jgi:uncharacterized protein YaiL (DUF2058 family)